MVCFFKAKKFMGKYIVTTYTRLNGVQIICYNLLEADLKFYCPKARDRNGNPFFCPCWLFSSPTSKKKIGMYSPIQKLNK